MAVSTPPWNNFVSMSIFELILVSQTYFKMICSQQTVHLFQFFRRNLLIRRGKPCQDGTRRPGQSGREKATME